MREISEECSIKVEVGSLLKVVSRIIEDDRGQISYHYIIIVYVCHFFEGILKAGSDVLEVRWIDIKDIKPLDISEGLPEIIQEGVRMMKGNISIS